MPKKYDHIDFKAPKSVRDKARQGLKWRDEYNRGGTAVGIARARDIVNGKSLSPDTVKRMHSFFSRHEKNKKAEGWNPGEKGYPSNGKISWFLWGGDAGWTWAKKVIRQMETADKKKKAYTTEDALVKKVQLFNKKGNKLRELLVDKGLDTSNPEVIRSLKELDRLAFDLGIENLDEAAEELVDMAFNLLNPTTTARFTPQIGKYALTRYKGVQINPTKRLALYLRDEFMCLYCGRDLHDADVHEITLDHIVPHNRGGDLDPKNLVTVCNMCNASRQDRPLHQFIPTKEQRQYIHNQRRRSYKKYRAMAKAFLASELTVAEIRQNLRPREHLFIQSS